MGTAWDGMGFDGEVGIMLGCVGVCWVMLGSCWGHVGVCWGVLGCVGVCWDALHFDAMGRLMGRSRWDGMAWDGRDGMGWDGRGTFGDVGWAC